MTTHVEFKTVAAGPDFSAQPGDRKLVDDDFAKALIEAGHAELVEDADAREDAMAEQRETATSRPARRRAKR